MESIKLPILLIEYCVVNIFYLIKFTTTTG